MLAALQPARTVPGPMPARAGIGLRAVHHAQFLSGRPAAAWLEAHSENYFAAGGAQRETIDTLSANYPLSLHGVGLSLGSTDPLDLTHLRRLRDLVRRTEPGFVSEHLSWSSVGGRFLNDLLPLPYTEEALRHMASRVRALQDYLGRRVLIENVSSYLQFTDSQLSEWDFLAALAVQADCQLLVDVNNVYVSARNHGFDPRRYLSALPAHRVAEMHLAGHTVNIHEGREILIDTHSARVSEPVWDLYDHALGCFGPLPTLIEWDTDIPSIDVLLEEAQRADSYLEKHLALAA
ncbi:MAG: DUF692 domain-containing protein [Pseudomonadota bacterium]